MIEPSAALPPLPKGTLQRLFGHRSARWALLAIALLIVGAIVGPKFLSSVAAVEQLDIVGLKNRPPSWAHPLGTDQYSRDLLARVLFGARVSLAVASLAVLMSATIGTGFGLVAGFVGGRIDTVMMRTLDAFLSIPRVLLLIAVLSLWAPVRLPGLILLLGGTGWFGLSRLVRAETIAARKLEYVEAARALGVPSWRIMWRHLLPNVATPVIVSATLAVGNVIALEAGLSFLGVGAPEPTASWGAIFYDAIQYGAIQFFAGSWWMLLFPGLAIVITVLAFNVLGDALRDVLDPRQLHGSESLPPAPVSR
ncbi:MAG TPA: ABC transporter permease [Gemmatimonadaceae bacterium]|nr:ABC transporter permease [Gemmatimonadaceae bacterium]